MSKHHVTARHTALTYKLRPRWQQAIDGGGVACWRCGGAILPGMKWDLGHAQDLALGGDPSDMRPEHRSKTGRCPGNRASGGKLGAAMTNRVKRQDRRMPSW